MQLGLNIPWDEAGIGYVASTGVTWGRIGWESGWALSDLDRIVGFVRKTPLKLVIAVTPGTRRYDDPKYGPTVLTCAERADAIEHYNEPNHQPFAVAPDAVAYARCALASVKAVKTKFPKVLNVLGGLAPDTGDRAPEAFLIKTLQTCPELATLVNFFALHPYEFPYDPRSFENRWNLPGQIKTMADTFVYFGRTGIKCWVTEYGAPGAPTAAVAATVKTSLGYPDAPYDCTEDGQADWMGRYLEAFARSGAVANAIWYNTIDGPGTGPLWETYCGIRRSNGTEKAVSRVLRGAAWGRK